MIPFTLKMKANSTKSTMRLTFDAIWEKVKESIQGNAHLHCQLANGKRK